MKAELKTRKRQRQGAHDTASEKTLSVMEAARNRPAPDFLPLLTIKQSAWAALPSGAKAVDGLTLPILRKPYKPLAAL